MTIVISLWVVLILAVFSVSLGGGVQSELYQNRHHAQAMKAFHLASAGVASAIRMLHNDETLAFDDGLELWADNPGAFNKYSSASGWFDVLYEHPGDDPIDPPYVFGVEDEDSKINLNSAPREVLMRLPGVDVQIADCVLDWRDSDDRSRPQGAEATDYQAAGLPYSCGNREFACLEELLTVKGVDWRLLEILRPHVTVYGDSKVNFLTASPEVLVALGASPSLVEEIGKFRSQEANLVLVRRDAQLNVDKLVDLITRRQLLNATEHSELRSLWASDKLKLSSEVFRIRAVGTAVSSVDEDANADAEYRLEVVYRRGSSPEGSAYLYWRED